MPAGTAAASAGFAAVPLQLAVASAVLASELRSVHSASTLVTPAGQLVLAAEPSVGHAGWPAAVAGSGFALAEHLLERTAEMLGAAGVPAAVAAGIASEPSSPVVVPAEAPTLPAVWHSGMPVLTAGPVAAPVAIEVPAAVPASKPSVLPALSAALTAVHESGPPGSGPVPAAAEFECDLTDSHSSADRQHFDWVLVCQTDFELMDRQHHRQHHN